MLKILLVGFIAAAMLLVGAGTACADQAWIDFVEYFLTLSIEEQEQLRSTMTPDELAYLEQMLSEQESATIAIPPLHNTQGKKVSFAGGGTGGWTGELAELSNPGTGGPDGRGYLHAFAPADGRVGYYIAPATLLGDWSDLTALRLVMRTGPRGGRYYDPYSYGGRGDIYLASGEMTASFTFTSPLSEHWETRLVPLDAEEGWRFGGGAGSLAEVLENVTAFHVRAEYLVGDADAGLAEIEMIGHTARDPIQETTITAGVLTQLTYTVVAQNLSGVPVVDPVIKDNGRILDNDEAVKTGGNQDNVLEVGETWTWTYQETVTAAAGETITNTATIEGPDDENLDTNPANNQATTTIDVVEPPGSYDLAITKTVTATEVAEAEEIPVTERETRILDECDVWSAANSGGYLGTRDPWDISALPPGTVFDIRFNARSVPDKYVVQYPVGFTVLDTGWRGVQSYVDRNPHLYPGGLSGPGQGQEDGIFVKGQEDTFVVIVYGPEEGTVWDYQIKANCPE